MQENSVEMDGEKRNQERREAIPNAFWNIVGFIFFAVTITVFAFLFVVTQGFGYLK